METLSGDNEIARPTKYRISTITATGRVNADLDLDLLFNTVANIIIDTGVGKTEEHVVGIVYAEFGKRRSSTYYKKFKKRFLTQRLKEHTTKRFDNQLTIIYKFNENCLLNMKIFKNGNVQMTGVKTIDDGSAMIDILLEYIRTAAELHPHVASSLDALQNKGYKVALINSDFKVGFEIKRNLLYSTLINTYNNKCSYEPCIYPGVKIQYYWNISNPKHNGICYCKSNCSVGKSDGEGEGHCKKITIAVFQSGCIIITGAQTTNQIDNAYDYICSVLYNHIDYIKKIDINTLLPVVKVEPKIKIVIKKSKVVYPLNYQATPLIQY